MLDWHGLTGWPAQPTVDVAARQGISTSTVYYRVRAVRAEGAQVPLTADMLAELTRRSVRTEDYLSRRRMAATLAVTAPAPPAAPGRPLAQTRAALVALDVLAATGGQPLSVLAQAVQCSRRFRAVTPTSPAELAAVLKASGLADLDSRQRWVLTAPRPPRERHAQLVAAAGGCGGGRRWRSC